MEEKARECLALNQYLSQIDSPQVAFSVRQRQPQTLVTAVGATIEMESYLQPKPSQIAQIEQEKATESVIAAIQHQQTTLLSALDKVMERLNKLEMKAQESPKGPFVGRGGGLVGDQSCAASAPGKGTMLEVVHHYHYPHH